MPILGICYGMQALNVIHGGSLYQHIDHPEEHVGGQFAQVRVEPETRLYAALNGLPILPTFCSHHQAVKRLGKGLRVAAVSP